MPLLVRLSLETMTTGLEAHAAVTAGLESGLPVWVSYTLDPISEKLRGGETIEHALKVLGDADVSGILFNCSACNTVSSALKTLRQNTDKPVGAYCNPVLVEPEGGEPEQVPTNRLSAQDYAKVAANWVNSGASLVGGCCDTDPDYIDVLRLQLCS